jgi:hypothetical protein
LEEDSPEDRLRSILLDWLQLSSQEDLERSSLLGTSAKE